jgi:pimeloyl-ACP methyl ester carboxylesterase
VKRVLLWLIALPVAAGLGLFAYGFWRERGFSGDFPPPGKHHGALGSRIHGIERLGGDPPIVFIHGNPGTCLDFAPVMAALSPRHRSFAFDRPGYGWSDRPEAVMGPTAQARALHDAVRKLGLVKPVLAGFSYGGPVAIAYALEYPGEVSALVLLAAMGSPDQPHRMSQAQAGLLEPWGALTAWTLGPLLAPQAVAEGYADAFFPGRVDPEVVERGRQQFSRPPTLLASARDWQALETELPKLAARYGELELPVEILSANQDRVVGPAHAAYLQAHLSGAHRADVDQAGHQLMSTHTSEVVDAVLRAVARLP